jgi:hypothetical protein
MVRSLIKILPLFNVIDFLINFIKCQCVNVSHTMHSDIITCRIEVTYFLNMSLWEQ